ncbi:MAG: glycoside hydrolase family 99-like domain-containing protein [Bacteroidaceae bacterium]|nr:glycoside hydrolase family 99-like domain-containing protein [Bacteroidaceae bacterium]
MGKKARVIAFYLPQYHPIPENDEWWGKGFTEWTNVGKAKPLFKGHYQPRVPADLGYYDLRLPIVREQQADMAREAGVEGFCYWHYWFGNGRTLLAEIFDDVLKSGKPDFPFCLGWANHTWTRRNWNGADKHKNEDLLLQTYPGEEDHVAHFYNVLPAFKDERYIKVDGKPLFLLYRPLDIPNTKQFIELWQRLAIKNGLKGIFFVGQNVEWRDYHEKILESGCDAITFENIFRAQELSRGGYLPFIIRRKLAVYFPKLAPLDIFDYEKIMKYWFTDYDYDENCYPTILPNWDRSPRAGRRAYIYRGSTPELFKKSVEKAVEIIKNKQPEHRIIFLKSWNEWAEGNYMEPDLRYGHGYLDALRDVVVEK